MDRFKRWISSDRGHLVIVIIVALFVALLIFHAGIVVGSHRHARGGNDWRFTGPGFSMHVPRDFIAEGHGAVGQIVSVASSSLVITTRDGSTRSVHMSSTTSLRSGRATTSASLSPGERIIVVGRPDESGAIDADLIRILLPSPSTTP